MPGRGTIGSRGRLLLWSVLLVAVAVCRGWQRVVMAGEVTARRSNEKPSRWSTSASSTEVGLSSDTPADSSPVAARTPTPLKKKRPSLTPSTSGQSSLDAPRSEDGGPSVQRSVEPERTPCTAEDGSRGPGGYPLHVDAEVPEEHRECVTPRLLVFESIPSESSTQTSSFGIPTERLAVAVSMCTPRSARVVQDTLAHCEDLTQGIESPRLQVVCLRQEVARLRQLLVESERHCRVLAEHSDGFWEEEVYDIINKIHTTSHGMQQEDGHHHHHQHHHHHGQRNGLPGRLWRWLSCSRLLR
ncbi:hypothetical protein FOZ63_020951 [Perkinsus olseni]|uniref:Uncharacterized protein n=1 Tax=Perkinsus olseni TaxID=32597 RepID=A0A7J6SY95_PEROL|nr:hypothetical protein FOZ63_020951 [Perkinsus olseni]